METGGSPAFEAGSRVSVQQVPKRKTPLGAKSVLVRPSIHAGRNCLVQELGDVCVCARAPAPVCLD